MNIIILKLDTARLICWFENWIWVRRRELAMSCKMVNCLMMIRSRQITNWNKWWKITNQMERFNEWNWQYFNWNAREDWSHRWTLKKLRLKKQIYVNPKTKLKFQDSNWIGWIKNPQLGLPSSVPNNVVEFVLELSPTSKKEMIKNKFSSTTSWNMP